MSDSQAVLKAISSCTVKSKLIKGCIDSLNALASTNRVVLKWIPGHEGFDGNEQADCLAKKGACTPFIGPEPFCGTSNSHTEEALRMWGEKSLSHYWTRAPGMRQAKKFITPARAKAKKLLELNKSELRILTGLLTGHAPVRYHLKIMGQIDTDTCRYCQVETETTEHVLCDCVALERRRFHHTGKARLTPKEVWITNTRAILRLISSLSPALG